MTFCTLASALVVLHLPVLPSPWILAAVAGCLCRYKRLYLRNSVAVVGGVIGAVMAAWPASQWQARLLPEACERLPVTVRGAVRGLPVYYAGRLDGKEKASGSAKERADEKADGKTDRGGQANRKRKHEPWLDSGTYRVELAVDSIEPESCAGPRRLRVYIPASRWQTQSPDQLPAQTQGKLSTGERRLAEPLAGEEWVLRGRLRRPWGLVNPGSATGEKYFLLSRIHAVGSVSSLDEARTPGDRRFADSLTVLRARLSKWLRANAGDEIGGLLAALAVGDRRYMPGSTWEQLRAFGLTHLLVISGMHVSLVAVPGFYLGSLAERLLSLRVHHRREYRLLPVLLGVIPAAVYAALAGLGVPTLRALSMLCLCLLLLLTGRPVHRGRVLALVALVLFLLDPLSVLSASYWLSLGAVALLFWYTLLNPQIRGLRQAAGMQCYMLFAMLPLGLFWFGAAAGIGAVVNLVAVPLVTLLVLPMLLLSLLLLGVSEPAALLVLRGAQIPFETLWHALNYWMPHVSAWSPRLAFLPGAATGAALLAVLLLAVPLRRVQLLAVLMLGVCLRTPPLSARADTQLTLLDVGQGTAALLTMPGYTLVYDTGGGPRSGPPIADRVLIPLVRRRGGAADGFVLSHPDQDHAAGEASLLALGAPAIVRRGVSAADDERCRMGEQLAPVRGLRLQFLSQRLGGDSDNNASCVVRLEVWSRSFMLPGDIDARREREIVAYWGKRLASDVLLSAHHGSASSNSRLWLRQVAPSWVVVSAKRANRFGHPAERTRNNVRERGALMLNTATAGALVFTISEDGALECHRSRHRRSPFWRRGPHPRDCMVARHDPGV